MKFTVLRKKTEEGEFALSTSDFQTFTESIKKDIRRGYITRYREIYNILDNKEAWENYWRIPQVCFTSELQTKGEKRCQWIAYNGISVVIVDNLNGKQEAEIIKRQSALFPQVLAAFLGGDGHSAVILTVTTSAARAFGIFHGQHRLPFGHRGERCWLNDEDEALIRETNESFNIETNTNLDRIKDARNPNKNPKS